MSRIVGVAVAALAVWLVITQPVAAAELARSGMAALTAAADGAGRFLLELTDVVPAATPSVGEPSARPPGIYGDHGRIEIVPNPDGSTG